MGMRPAARRASRGTIAGCAQTLAAGRPGGRLPLPQWHGARYSLGRGGAPARYASAQAPGTRWLPVGGHMQLDPGEMTAQQVYKLLTGLVIPRPIGFASTVGVEDIYNLAPFSFFMPITPSPPHIALSIGTRSGEMKDTLRNIEQSGELVINVVSAPIAARMNVTSGDWPRAVSEFKRAGLTPIPSVRVRAPRVAEAVAQMECVARHITPIGGPPYGAHVVIAEVIYFHVRDDILLERGRIDLQQVEAVGRLAGDWFCSTTDQFEIHRPRVGDTLSFGVHE